MKPMKKVIVIALLGLGVSFSHVVIAAAALSTASGVSESGVTQVNQQLKNLEKSVRNMSEAGALNMGTIFKLKKFADAVVNDVGPLSNSLTSAVSNITAEQASIAKEAAINRDTITAEANARTQSSQASLSEFHKTVDTEASKAKSLQIPGANNTYLASETAEIKLEGKQKVDNAIATYNTNVSKLQKELAALEAKHAALLNQTKRALTQIQSAVTSVGKLAADYNGQHIFPKKINGYKATGFLLGPKPSAATGGAINITKLHHYQNKIRSAASPIVTAQKHAHHAMNRYNSPKEKKALTKKINQIKAQLGKLGAVSKKTVAQIESSIASTKKAALENAANLDNDSAYLSKLKKMSASIAKEIQEINIYTPIADGNAETAINNIVKNYLHNNTIAADQTVQTNGQAAINNLPADANQATKNIITKGIVTATSAAAQIQNAYLQGVNKTSQQAGAVMDPFQHKLKQQIDKFKNDTGNTQAILTAQEKKASTALANLKALTPAEVGNLVGALKSAAINEDLSGRARSAVNKTINQLKAEEAKLKNNLTQLNNARHTALETNQAAQQITNKIAHLIGTQTTIDNKIKAMASSGIADIANANTINGNVALSGAEAQTTTALTGVQNPAAITSIKNAGDKAALTINSFHHAYKVGMNRRSSAASSKINGLQAKINSEINAIKTALNGLHGSAASMVTQIEAGLLKGNGLKTSETKAWNKLKGEIDHLNLSDKLQIKNDIKKIIAQAGEITGTFKAQAQSLTGAYQRAVKVADTIQKVKNEMAHLGAKIPAFKSRIQKIASMTIPAIVKANTMSASPAMATAQTNTNNALAGSFSDPERAKIEAHSENAKETINQLHKAYEMGASLVGQKASEQIRDLPVKVISEIKALQNKLGKVVVDYKGSLGYLIEQLENGDKLSNNEIGYLKGITARLNKLGVSPSSAFGHDIAKINEQIKTIEGSVPQQMGKLTTMYQHSIQAANSLQNIENNIAAIEADQTNSGDLSKEQLANDIRKIMANNTVSTSQADANLTAQQASADALSLPSTKYSAQVASNTKTASASITALHNSYINNINKSTASTISETNKVAASATKYFKTILGGLKGKTAQVSNEIKLLKAMLSHASDFSPTQLAQFNQLMNDVKGTISSPVIRKKLTHFQNIVSKIEKPYKARIHSLTNSYQNGTKIIEMGNTLSNENAAMTAFQNAFSNNSQSKVDSTIDSAQKTYKNNAQSTYNTAYAKLKLAWDNAKAGATSNAELTALGIEFRNASQKMGAQTAAAKKANHAAAQVLKTGIAAIYHQANQFISGYLSKHASLSPAFATAITQIKALMSEDKTISLSAYRSIMNAAGLNMANFPGIMKKLEGYQKQINTQITHYKQKYPPFKISPSLQNKIKNAFSGTLSKYANLNQKAALKAALSNPSSVNCKAGDVLLHQGRAGADCTVILKDKKVVLVPINVISASIMNQVKQKNAYTPIGLNSNIKLYSNDKLTGKTTPLDDVFRLTQPTLLADGRYITFAPSGKSYFISASSAHSSVFKKLSDYQRISYTKSGKAIFKANYLSGEGYVRSPEGSETAAVGATASAPAVKLADKDDKKLKKAGASEQRVIEEATSGSAPDQVGGSNNTLKAKAAIGMYPPIYAKPTSDDDL
jgi:hypothetical protein